MYELWFEHVELVLEKHDKVRIRSWKGGLDVLLRRRIRNERNLRVLSQDTFQQYTLVQGLQVGRTTWTNVSQTRVLQH